LSADEWSAFGDVVLAVGAVATAAGALYSYWKTKRSEAARWLQGMFQDFYLNDRIRRIKQQLEYDYAEKIGPLLERRLTNRDIPVVDGDRTILDDIDTLLNYFEQVLYLEENDHVKRDDREAIFGYWFDLMGADARGSLRRYAAVWGWERLAHALTARRDEYIAVYGSLREGQGLPDAPELDPYLEREPGGCEIRG
jgi:hypothetical protein